MKQSISYINQLRKMSKADQQQQQKDASAQNVKVSQYLKVGDCIILYSEHCEGFMSTVGFHSQDVVIQTCTPDTIKLMPNMRNMVYRVMPKLVYDATREYNKEKKAYDQMVHEAELAEKSINVDGDEKKDDEAAQEREMAARNLQMLQTRMTQEQEYNTRINKSRQGEIVIYGSQIQLQHLDSGAYLQISKKQADQWKDCFKFELSMNPTPSRVIFDILPRYKYRSEGDRVCYEDHILFLNTNKHGYIHYSKDIPLPVEENRTMNSTFRPNCPDRRPQLGAVFKRYEVNIGQEASKWQIFPYRQFQDERVTQRLVFGGSVIRLKHAESGGYICLDDDGKLVTGESQGYLRIYTGAPTGEDAEEQMSSNSLFEVELDLKFVSGSPPEYGQATTWVNEAQNNTPVNYRFRHLNSGKVLSVKTISKNGKDIHVLTSSHVIGPKDVLGKDVRFPGGAPSKDQQQLDEFNKEMAEVELRYSLFNLQSSTIDNDNFINNDSVVKIISVANNYFLTSVKKKSHEEEEEDEANMGNETQDSAAEDLELLLEDKKDDFEMIGDGKSDTKIYQPMNKDEFDFLRSQTLMLRKNHKEEDVFIIKKADPSEISDILFIHSCVDDLKQYIYNLRKKLVENLTITYFVHVEELISNMIFFVTETESTDAFNCEGIPFKKRQKQMRETRVIDLLVDMLVYPFSDKLYNFADLTQKSPITRICQLVYRLLKHCVKDYNYNKFYVAQYIELYFNQAMTATEQNNFRAEGTITELLKNNEVLLDKQITKDTIVNFVELCKGQMKNERFLNLLATLCSCNGEAVNSNQDDTCEILLENDDNNKALIMKMVATRGNDYEIVLSEPEIDPRTLFIGITNLYEVSLKRDDLRIFNYFKALINLNAEMCLQRNYRGINSLVDVYPLEQVYHCTVNENVHLLLRAQFAKFLLHLHIDKDPLEQITVPYLARMWPDIVYGRTQLPRSKVNIGVKLLQLKPFAAKFFGDLGGVQKAFETDFNTYIVQLLSLVDAMVRLGFYNDEDDLISVIDPLISLLDGSLDIIDQEQLSRKNTNKNNSIGEGGEDGQQPAENNGGQSMLNNSQTMNSMMKKDSEEQILRMKRYKMNESNLLIMETKNNIINILQKVLDIQNDVRLTQFLTEFHTSEMNEPAGDAEINFINTVTKHKKLDELFKKDPELSDLKPQIDQKVINWMNTAFGDKKLDLERISVADFVCVLLDLILYENSSLVNNAFKLLVRFFQQKQAIIDLASTVQILEKDSEIAILKSVQMQLTEMKREADNAEFWLGFTGRNELMKARNFMERFDMLADLCVKKSESPYDFTDNNRLTHSIIKSEVAKLIQKRGRQNKMAQESQSAILNDVSEMTADWEDDDTRVIQENEETDEQNQRLLRNLRAHEIALIIVRQKNLDETENSHAYLRVLEKAYIFLIKFVRNNRENQLILLEKIDEFLTDVEFGVHAFELISEILKNNEKLTSFNMLPLTKKVCQIADEQSIEAPKKATLVSFLQYFMYCNGVVLKDNQTMILNEITNSSRKNSINLFTVETGFEQLELYIEEMRRHYVSISNDPSPTAEIFMPNELSYNIQFIKLLAISGGGRNAMTELKCQSFFSIRDIVENMKYSSFCYPVKEACLDFLLQIYLDTEKDISEDYHSSLWEVIEIMYEDLKKFIEIKINIAMKAANQAAKSTDKKTLMNSGLDGFNGVDISRNFYIRDCFGAQPVIKILENYIFMQVIPNLNKFFELRLKMNEKQTNLVRNAIRLIAESSKHAAQSGVNQYIRNINTIYKTFWKIPQLKELTEGLKNQSIQLLQEKQSGMLPAVDGGSSGLAGKGGPSKAMQLKAYMRSAVMSEEVRNEIELEFQQLIYSIMFIKKKSEIGFNGKNTLETKEILQSLIKLTDVQSEIDKDLRKTSLKILRKIIEMENKDLTTPAAEWDNDDWGKYEYQIGERQNMMTSLGMVKLICRTIALEQSLCIKEEAFLAAIALLLGGNEKSQMKFCRYIMKDSENLFVLKLKETITTCYELIKKSEARRNILMQKHYSISNKIEEMIELIGNSEHNEIKKLEQQLIIVEEEMKEAESQYETADDEVLTPQRALKYLQTIMRFMQLLCENHNINLQNMLRVQINIDGNESGKSFDFISQLARMVGEFYKIFSSNTCDLGQQMIDSLIEFIQGPCLGNQDALISAKIIDSSRDFLAGFEKPNEFLPLGFTTDDEDVEKIAEFKSKIVTLLLSLLEGDLDKPKIQKMSNALDFTVVKDRMLTVFTIFAEGILEQSDIDVATLTLSQVNNRLVRDSFEGPINEAFELFILMQTLAQNSDVAKLQLERKRFSTEQWKAYDFIRSHTGKIEIQVDGNLQSVYFPIRPACHYISEESKKKLMLEVNRESQSNKVEGLMKAAPDLIDEMMHNEALGRSKFAITPERLALLKDFSTLLSVLMNLILIIFVERTNHFREVYVPQFAEDMITYGGIIQGVSSGVLILFYAMARGGLITKAKWRDFVKANQKTMPQFENEDRLDITEMSIEMTHNILMTKGPEASEFEVDGQVHFGNCYTRFEYYIFNILFFIQDGKFIYYCLYFMISMLGYFYLDIFYALHLLDFITRSPTLQNVIKSVTLNGGQFLMTALLLFTIIFIYTTIGFFYLQDTYIDLNVNKFEDVPNENFCTTMLQCFVKMADAGLRNGGGIGDATLPITYDNNELYFVKFLFDASFHILVIIVMINILFGIIIDTFAQLRDTKQTIDWDMRNICYICSIDRNTFDKYSDGFERHIARDHNLWQYVFYIVHLQSKDSTEYTGIESYVIEKYESGDITWVPLMKAICLIGTKYETSGGGEEAAEEGGE